MSAVRKTRDVQVVLPADRMSVLAWGRPGQLSYSPKTRATWNFMGSGLWVQNGPVSFSGFLALNPHARRKTPLLEWRVCWTEKSQVRTPPKPALWLSVNPTSLWALAPSSENGTWSGLPRGFIGRVKRDDACDIPRMCTQSSALITITVINKPRPGPSRDSPDPEISAGETSACVPGDTHTDTQRSAAGNGGEAGDTQRCSMSLWWDAATYME